MSISLQSRELGPRNVALSAFVGLCIAVCVGYAGSTSWAQSSGGAVPVGGGTVTASQAAMEATDLPGGDIASYHLESGNFRECARICTQVSGCRAWTYQDTGVPGGAISGRCWIKNIVPPTVYASCCVSGIIAPPAVAVAVPAAPSGTGMPQSGSQLLLNTNLFGSDITGFDVASGRPEDCAALCARNGSCRAWTLVSAGIQGPVAKCWIKSAVPPGTINACCTSGLR